MSEGLTNTVDVSRLLVKLLEREDDEFALRAAQRLHDRVSRRDMESILDRIPGTPSERIRKLGVSKQTYYNWIRGRQRPEGDRAKRVAKLSGVAVEEIVANKI